MLMNHRWVLLLILIILFTFNIEGSDWLALAKLTHELYFVSFFILEKHSTIVISLIILFCICLIPFTNMTASALNTFEQAHYIL